MTLRHRLLLVYLIVVLLSAVTVGAAVFELQRAHQILTELQAWNRIVVNFERERPAWPPPPGADVGDLDLRATVARQFLFLTREFPDRPPVYVDMDQVRQALNEVSRQAEAWASDAHGGDPPEPDPVKAALEALSTTLDNELAKLNREADRQRRRSLILVGVVVSLTALHVLCVGWLLRRWLLYPMERLNRQVDALARDEPPGEPLLESPHEMANLARALDRARQSLGALREQLLIGERLTTIGRFATQLAHNLRNPLASIRAAAQVTHRHAAGDGYVTERMEEVIQSVDRLNQWIARLMEVARRDPSPSQHADVVALLERVERAVRSELTAKELALRIEAPADGLHCWHDPATLEHAMIAVVMNAIEASPLHGTVVVRAQRSADDGQDGHCRVSVEDAGGGLPRDDPERIFDLTYSTKQHGMGLGLGLARQAIERQGGSIHARNNTGGGATIWVELPLAPPDGQPGTENREPGTEHGEPGTDD